MGVPSCLRGPLAKGTAFMSLGTGSVGPFKYGCSAWDDVPLCMPLCFREPLEEGTAQCPWAWAALSPPSTLGCKG
eukprot:131253-Pelagomonas_calceolata.AAC.3